MKRSYTVKLKRTNIYDMYKINLVELFYNIVSDNTPPLISDLAMWIESQYNLRGHKKATVPRFSTHFMKHSIRFRGAVLWNFVSDYLNDSHNLNLVKYVIRLYTTPQACILLQILIMFK